MEAEAQPDLHADPHRLGALHLLDDDTFVSDGNAELHCLADGVPQPAHRIEGAFDETDVGEAGLAEAQELPGEPESPTGLIPHEVVPRDECLKQPRRRIFRTADGIAQFGEGHPLGISIENFEDRKSAVQGGSWAGRKSMRSGRGTGGFYIWN